MTTFTGDLNVKPLDSSTTVASIQRGGGLTATGPVVFTSSVVVSGAAAFGGTVNIQGLLTVVSGFPVSALTLTTAASPVVFTPATQGGIVCRGMIRLTVDGTSAYVPFWYGGT